MILVRQNVIIDVIYYMPDHRDLVQEFIWQTQDLVPTLPRTHSFLNFWKTNIDARIKEVLWAHSQQTNWRRIDFES